MIIKFLEVEDFVNYKKPSMFIGTPYCSFKCDKEYGTTICQNSELIRQYSFDISNDRIVDLYTQNEITKAVVFGGLEPLDSMNDVLDIIKKIRKKCNDDIVIYTGYTEEECLNMPKFNELISLGHIIIKFGRFIPNVEGRQDDILGVKLASYNQYAKEYI